VAAQPSAAAQGQVDSWLTTADQSHLLAPQSPLNLSTSAPQDAHPISVDSSKRYQVMDGFGASLTDSSAYVISQLPASKRGELMMKLFNVNTGAGLSYLRQPMGASDFARSNYTYDDMPAGQTDPMLAHFSVAHDDAYILPLLRQALAINPSLKVMATPWSPPAWMRTGHSLIGASGGTLEPQYYDAYAQYFVKFVEAYAAAGVPVDAVTLQNEPEFAPEGYPGMLFSPADQATFIIHLGPALRAAGLSTKIMAFDHNWDLSSYAKTVLDNTNAAQYVAGTAFHCYGGDPSAQSDVHDVAPSKDVYLTECSGGDWSPDFGANLNWGVGNLAIGAIRNWAKTVLLWNLALDTRGGPTNGGCTNCRGVVTVDPSSGAVDYNVDYYVLGAFSKVVQPGAVRIDSSTLESIGVQNVAFLNPDGSSALVALNWGKTAQSVSVNADGQSFTTSIPVGSAASFRWTTQEVTPTTTTSASTGRLSRRYPATRPSLHAASVRQRRADS